jgi:hypothetical protein
MSISLLSVRASTYQQFDADHSRDVPAESYGGWGQVHVEIDLERTAVVVMHAWDTGTLDLYPGWYRAVEYLPRAQHILRTVFPPLLAAIRDHGVTLFHVVGGGDYYRDCPGYRRALALAGPEPARDRIAPDPSLIALRRLHQERTFVGPHNEADVARARGARDFAPEAQPEDQEGVAESAGQLFALCASQGIYHLIYAGFAINWCLLMSPGGMLDMSRRGLMCSAFRQAVTAVENRASARGELHKESALWRVALAFGFVFDVADFVSALAGGGRPSAGVTSR